MPGNKNSGRKRLPTALLKLHGTYRPNQSHKDRGKEPVATGDPVRPRGLDSRSRAIWDRVIPKLIDMGVATAADQDSLDALVYWLAEFRRLRGDSTARQAEIINADKRFAFYAAAFGLTPVARASLSVEKKVATDPAAKYVT